MADQPTIRFTPFILDFLNRDRYLDARPVTTTRHVDLTRVSPCVRVPVPVFSIVRVRVHIPRANFLFPRGTDTTCPRRESRDDSEEDAAPWRTSKIERSWWQRWRWWWWWCYMVMMIMMMMMMMMMMERIVERTLWWDDVFIGSGRGFGNGWGYFVNG